MADASLISLLFRRQSLHRKAKRHHSRSRILTLSDGREIRRGYAYELRRREALQRDGYRCALCGSAYGVQVHHRTKRSILRDDRMGNLITLCENCHTAEHEE